VSECVICVYMSLHGLALLGVCVCVRETESAFDKKLLHQMVLRGVRFQ